MTTSEAIKPAGPAGATPSADPAVGEAFVSPDPQPFTPTSLHQSGLKVVTILGTKGGIGKTTLGVNLGAALADMNQRVLLVDADPQGSLTKYYPLRQEARNGLYAAMRRGAVTADCISETSVPNLSLLKSDMQVLIEGQDLSTWLSGQKSTLYRLERTLNVPLVYENYEFVIIDTRGTTEGPRGPLQAAAAQASGYLLLPIVPETMSAREFMTATRDLLRWLTDTDEPYPPRWQISALFYMMDRTRDAKRIVSEIKQALQHEWRALGPHHFSLLQTMVPLTKAYKEAATLGVPAHTIDLQSGATPCAYEVMYSLLHEIFPVIGADRYLQAARQEGDSADGSEA